LAFSCVFVFSEQAATHISSLFALSPCRFLSEPVEPTPHDYHPPGPPHLHFTSPQGNIPRLPVGESLFDSSHAKATPHYRLCGITQAFAPLFCFFCFFFRTPMIVSASCYPNFTFALGRIYVLFFGDLPIPGTDGLFRFHVVLKLQSRYFLPFLSRNSTGSVTVPQAPSQAGFLVRPAYQGSAKTTRDPAVILVSHSC